MLLLTQTADRLDGAIFALVFFGLVLAIFAVSLFAVTAAGWLRDFHRRGMDRVRRYNAH